MDWLNWFGFGPKSSMCEFCEAITGERETIGQRYAIACAVVNFPFDYVHVCMHFL